MEVGQRKWTAAVKLLAINFHKLPARLEPVISHIIRHTEDKVLFYFNIII